MISKQELRQIFKNKRKSLSQEEIKIKSTAINNNFIVNLLPKIYQKNSKTVFSLYLSSGNEVTTEEISQYFISNNINFSYPRIISLDTPLEFFLFEKDQAFSPNHYFPKILEPNKGQIILPDIIILPLLAFDSKLSRLGMGGGFFDRTINFLKKEKNIITIGLAYDFQGFIDVLPTERTDQKLDFIVTETSIFL